MTSYLSMSTVIKYQNVIEADGNIGDVQIARKVKQMEDSLRWLILQQLKICIDD